MRLHEGGGQSGKADAVGGERKGDTLRGMQRQGAVSLTRLISHPAQAHALAFPHATPVLPFAGKQATSYWYAVVASACTWIDHIRSGVWMKACILPAANQAQGCCADSRADLAECNRQLALARHSGHRCDDWWAPGNKDHITGVS